MLQSPSPAPGSDLCIALAPMSQADRVGWGLLVTRAAPGTPQPGSHVPLTCHLPAFKAPGGRKEGRLAVL